MKVVFDRGPLGGRTAFAEPIAVIRAGEPAQVPGAIANMERARREGFWLAGHLAYELGYCLAPRLAPLLPPERDTPLLAMGVFRDCRPAAPLPAPPPDWAVAVRPRWRFEDYRPAFERVRAYLAAGDCYQINLTFPLEVETDLAPEALYAALAAGQPVGHGAYLDLGGPLLLSRSPELFFAVDREGWIEARPMKGTAPRHADPAADRAAAEELCRSEKNRAENLMIVDLLRNDLTRVAEIGTVRVPALFEVERYATVHQMTSTVRARLRPGVTLARLLRALFPCGSVTGAPKIRAMEIIRELEPWPRGAYCGALGWIAPDGAMAFNVAIRTLAAHGDGRLLLNVGGGVVYDSTAEAEYEEALWKSRFLQPSPAG